MRKSQDLSGKNKKKSKKFKEKQELFLFLVFLCYAQLVTIVVLVILAGITLNAVIGEDGIIFQAKDTKNMITNETEYDNQQLAALQNELRDNELYTGIGIIPGTDTGGSSEGGESGSGGSGGSGNQGGSNTGGTNTNTGGSDGSMIGGDAVPPTITVLEGEEIAASFFRSDVTIQIATTDKTLRIKYILTTTVDEINNELYPSGLIKEIDIENGGTLTFTKDGEYTITAYSYDLEGKKSNSSIMWLKRETGTTPGNGVTVSIASGNMGQNEWYTSNITLRVLGTDTGSSRVTYRVRGTAYSNGTIGNTEYQAGAVDTNEVEIANGTTFRIAIDGEFAIVAYTYDSGGMRLSTANTVNVKRDASRPIVTLYKGEQVIGEGFRISMSAEDYASDLATEGRYTYRHKLAPNMTYTDNLSQETTYLYTGLEADKTYDMYMIVKDEAGNMTASDVISRPAIWVTSGTSPENYTEGKRSYYSSDIEISMTGQDENNVDIPRVTYQILGTTTNSGTIDGKEYGKGVALPETEYEMGNKKSFVIAADGHWTVKVHTYNKENERVSTNTIEVTRDTTGPVITSVIVESASETSAKMTVTAMDETTEIKTYQYNQNTTSKGNSASNTYTYTGLSKTTDFSTLNVIVADKCGNTTQGTPTETIYYLVDRVTVGDYVAYNAGTWDSTIESPTSNATFGGYTEGQDKGTSVSGNTSGWRVLSKSGSGETGTVTLISAGSPALGYCASGNGNINNTVNGLNNFASNNFLNSTYASSARNANNSDVSQMDTAGVKVIGTNYWLATKASITTYNYSGVSSNQRRYWFEYNTSTRTYDYKSWWYYYATSRSKNGTYYGLYALNASGNNITKSVNGSSGGGTTYTASSRRYYYAYEDQDGDTPVGSRLYSLTSGTIYCFDSNSTKSTLSGTYNQAYGIRPVVVLKAGVKTESVANEEYLEQTCWKLQE